ncbi:hypothetical protein Sm713_18110 [Streptomyces sp. TS71-3]|nr:hypothetical protein Sm713_18110 [Streptomyces sp. TS71-3]
MGPLDLRYEKLALPGAPGQMLITYHAEPGSDSHERLQLLAHLATRPATAATTGQEADSAPQAHARDESAP